MKSECIWLWTRWTEKVRWGLRRAAGGWLWDLKKSRCLCASLKWRWSQQSWWMEACSQRATVTSATPSSSLSPSAPLTMRVRSMPIKCACSICFTLKMEDRHLNGWDQTTQTAQKQKWTGTSAVRCVTCSSPPPLWPSRTTRARRTPRESAWSWGSRLQRSTAQQTQILCRLLQCPQTQIHVPILPPHCPGPSLLLVEMAGEKRGSIAACAEPGSITPWWPSSTMRARNTEETQPGHVFLSS